MVDDSCEDSTPRSVSRVLHATGRGESAVKLHTKLISHEIIDALWDVKKRGLMTRDIDFVQFEYENSRTHPNGYLIQLGTDDKTSGPTNSRHYKNSGQWGADTQVWAATYDEWGWFIAELFERDPDAKFGHYKSYDDFHAQTKTRFQGE
jgi:hypothetical protein